MAHATAHLVFAEDFDEPRPVAKPPEPAPAEPVYSAADLQTARAEALREGHAAGMAEAEESNLVLARDALLAIAGRLDTAREEARTIAEEAAEALGRLVMDALAAAFPALCARHAEAELSAIVRAILPRLHEEPEIVVRTGPHMTAALTQEIAALDPDLLDRVRLIPTDAIPPGDMRISWRAGSVRRDTAGLWADIENILAPAGLLSPAVRATITRKETENVE